MRKSLLLLSVPVLLLCYWSLTRAGERHTHATSRQAPAEPTPPRATEQEWIVGQVVATIAGIAAPAASAAQPVPVRVVPDATQAGRDRLFAVVVGNGMPIQVEVKGHLWSPETFGSVAGQLLQRQLPGSPTAPVDLAARSRLTDLTVATLLAENERISMLLEQDMRSAGAHEAAALLLGAFALRESSGSFYDVRSTLSRMTAHLAVARALGPDVDGMDGILARTILTALAGLQREAMTTVEAFERQATINADRQWLRALKLRISGDWRGPAPTVSNSLLERVEHARAVRERIGIDAFMDYVDTMPTDMSTDWQRIVFRDSSLTVEAGNVFTPENVDRELEESTFIWTRFHGVEPTAQAVIEDLNEPPNSAIRQDGTVRVLDWGTWAAHQQRHLLHALMAVAEHSGNRGDHRRDLISGHEDTFASLMLYPIALRSFARSGPDYQRALAAARPLVEQSPELVTQAAWTLFLQPLDSAGRPEPFPLETRWFTPAVPTGTAFELAERSLRPGNPRPPTRAQIAQWAIDRPYDHWTLWAKEWLSVDGRPELVAVGTALNPLFGYDVGALFKMIEYMNMPDSTRVDITSALCDMTATYCDRLGELQLLLGNEEAAATAYERWALKSRDRVGVASGVTWLVRYQERVGNTARAEALAREAGDTGSYRGMQELAEWLDRAGLYQEAEAVYRRLAARYDDATVPLGTFLMRQALRTDNTDLETEANEMLRPLFPAGLEPLARQNLPARATEGVGFATFGPRPRALGMQTTDIIVAVNGWRVRSADQYIAVTRFSHDDVMTLTIWRDAKYQEVRIRVPERSFGTRFKDHRGDPPV